MPVLVRVIVTANSVLTAKQLARELAGDTSLHICTATTTAELWKQIETCRPQVVVLDTQVAGEGTAQLVCELKRAGIATLLRSDAAADTLLGSLQAGALAVLDKPDSSLLLAQLLPTVIWNIRAAASANLRSDFPPEFPLVESNAANAILAIGAGMGGLPALTHILKQLPSDAPGSIVISPLPASLTGRWAEQLNHHSRVRVKLACDGDVIQSGMVLIAPGDSHVMLRRSPQGFAVAVKNGPAVFHHKPSMEVLFNSVAQTAAGDAVGVLLSSAGVDGVAGLMNLRKAGGRTLTESSTTCVIADGPSRAIKCGAAEAALPANQIAAKMMELAVQSTLRAA